MFGSNGSDDETNETNNLTSNTNNSSGTHADRSVNVDDIFQQICSRMSNLSTDVKDSKPEVIDIFKSVLLCSEMEAEFFLDSADWDIASVSMYSSCRVAPFAMLSYRMLFVPIVCFLGVQHLP